MSKKFDLKEKFLLNWTYRFECPYCGRTWDRGGHKEGFVKAAAMRHVYGCWTVLVFVRYHLIPMGWAKGRQKFMSDTEARKHPHILKSVKSLVRRRKREGYAPAP